MSDYVLRASSSSSSFSSSPSLLPLQEVQQPSRTIYSVNVRNTPRARPPLHILLTRGASRVQTGNPGGVDLLLVVLFINKLQKSPCPALLPHPLEEEERIYSYSIPPSAHASIAQVALRVHSVISVCFESPSIRFPLLLLLVERGDRSDSKARRIVVERRITVYRRMLSPMPLRAASPVALSSCPCPPPPPLSTPPPPPAA